MKHYFRGVFPAVFFRDAAYGWALLLGLGVTAIAICQLFRFEDYAGVMLGYRLPGGETVAVLLAGMAPLIEIMGLPYLLSMRVPLIVWWISRICAVAAPVYWILVGVWLTWVWSSDTDTGLLGATIPLPNGLWLVIVAALWLYAVAQLTRRLSPRSPLE